MNEGDPRVKRTRKLVVDAFMSLLAEKGFHAITVQDIAERATVNRATFYAHFEDKYALMDWVVRDGFRQALRECLGAAPPFTLDNLHLLAITACEFLGEFHGHCAPGDRDLAPLMLEAKVQEELYAFLLTWLRDAGPACVTSTANREAAAVVMSWAIFGAGIQWSRGERTIPAVDWARQVVTMLVGGASQTVTVPSGAAVQARGGTALSTGNGARSAHR